jgi:hypothetical protein
MEYLEIRGFGSFWQNDKPATTSSARKLISAQMTYGVSVTSLTQANTMSFVHQAMPFLKKTLRQRNISSFLQTYHTEYFTTDQDRSK